MCDFLPYTYHRCCCRFEEGIECLKKEISAYSLVEGHAHIRNVIISIVLVYLHQEDYVAANNFFTNSLGYCMMMQRLNLCLTKLYWIAL